MSVVDPRGVMFHCWKDRQHPEKNERKREREKTESHGPKTCKDCGDDTRWWPGDAMICNGCEIRKARK